MMLRRTHVVSGLILLLAGTLLSSCNIKGFFQSYEDDPAWEDNSGQEAIAAAAGGNATAGGPGASVYNKICASCHQGTGAGLPGVYPPLAGSAFVQGDPTVPIKIVLHGFQGKISRAGKDYNGLMAPWKDVLSDEDVANVLTYVRSSWGNNGSAVTPEEVKAVREATVTRSKGFAEAELLQ